MIASSTREERRWLRRGAEGWGRPLLPRCPPAPPGGAIAPQSLAGATEIPHSGLEKPRKRRGNLRRGRFRLQLVGGGPSWGRSPWAGHGCQNLGESGCKETEVAPGRGQAGLWRQGQEAEMKGQALICGAAPGTTLGPTPESSCEI